MKVKELIEKLQAIADPELDIVYHLYSEYCVLDDRDIEVRILSVPRPDGWVHARMPHRAEQEYLVFPGN